MKTKRRISFTVKLTVLISSLFAAMLIIFSLIFYHMGSVLEDEAISSMEYSAMEISRDIDDIILNIYSVSDTFAIDDRLEEYTSVPSETPIKKRFTTTRISNILFASYDLLRSNEKMAAFYNNRTGEVFNFLDPNKNDMQCKKDLEALDINSADKLAKFCWYSVRDNFLLQDLSGDLRSDKAVIGSRRVFSRLYNSYVGVHIFAISEKKLYETYSEITKQFNSEIYILSEKGALLSCSNEEVLSCGAIDEDIKNAVLNREYDRFNQNGKTVFVYRSDVNGWLTVIAVPNGTLTAMVDRLSRWLYAIVILFAVIACIMLYFMYKSFMRPIARLNAAMRRVHDGDMDAYVEVTDNELGDMMRYFNSMLESINNSMANRLKAEKHKKQLEIDILMNQINPHFLYNTLETIVWKSVEAGSPNIGKIAAALGRMYRLSINGGKLFVPVRQEVEHVSSYIKIQEQRYGGRFEYIADTQQASSDWYTIKMLLQPIVENSLSHAMDGLERIMRVRLSVKPVGERMRIRVTDTGKGMNAEVLAAVRRLMYTGEPIEKNDETKKSTGIGIRNVYERLKIYFGDDADVRIFSKRNLGTVVELMLPIVSAEEAEKYNREFKEK